MKVAHTLRTAICQGFKIWRSCLLMLASLSAIAQNHTVKLQGNPAEMRLLLEMGEYDSLQLLGYNGDEIQITAKRYKAPPAKAEGLRSLYSKSVDNTGIGLAIKYSGNEVRIEQASREDNSYLIKVPRDMAVSLTETGWNCDDLVITDMAGELEIEAKGSDVVLRQIGGPLVVSTTNGDLTVVYNALNQQKPHSLKSINGGVDITMPPGTAASLKMRSTNGEIFTNFDIQTLPETEKEKEKRSQNCCYGYTINGQINGGGTEMSIYAINDNIYLRKQ